MYFNLVTGSLSGHLIGEVRAESGESPRSVYPVYYDDDVPKGQLTADERAFYAGGCGLPFGGLTGFGRGRIT